MKLNLVDIEKKPRVEMLPLIDIVFLLLVVFIYAMLSMAVHRGIDVDLPVAGNAEIDTENLLSVTLQATEHGGPATLLIGNEKIDLESLGQNLLTRGKGNLDKEILLFADKSVPYQEVFHVLDAIRSVGLHRISLQAKSSE